MTNYNSVQDSEKTLARRKIREKKPRNNIKIKIPTSSRVQEIKQKTPDSSDLKSFEIPPPKERRGIPKDEVKLPSQHGSSDQNKKESIDSNISPPINESVLYEAKSPTKKGLIPKGVRKKFLLDKKTPIPKQINKIDTILRSRGVVHSKKALSNTVNRPPPLKSQEKIPKKAPIQHHTAGVKKEQKSAINRPPPPKIHKKTPAKKKIIPPPIFDDIKTKIPKTKLKTKKPR